MTGLFPPDLPAGFRYEEALLSPAAETHLLAAIADVAFSAFEMRGVVARRRVAFFGHAYDATRPSRADAGVPRVRCGSVRRGVGRRRGRVAGRWP